MVVVAAAGIIFTKGPTGMDEEVVIPDLVVKQGWSRATQLLLQGGATARSPRR